MKPKLVRIWVTENTFKKVHLEKGNNPRKKIYEILDEWSENHKLKNAQKKNKFLPNW